MLNLRINPIVAKDLKNIRDYIAEDSEEYATKTIKEIYGKFENLQMFPGMGSDLSKRVTFQTDYKYAIWEDYVIIYKINDEYLEIDTKERTIFSYSKYGEKRDLFHFRGKERSNFFEKFPSGTSTVAWNGMFKAELIIYETRGEPKWI